MAKLKIFISEHCLPCQQLKEIAKNGGFGDDVEVIDIETEEGFPKIAEMELVEIPVAYEDGKKCAIKYSNDNIEIKCPAENKIIGETETEVSPEGKDAEGSARASQG
ncbi:MAG TPA: hypothetical protein VMY79_02880 [Dehalococcoidia bacterium]|nr:hypothetical protein [Dehalococcoidia bacterium]